MTVKSLDEEFKRALQPMSKVEEMDPALSNSTDVEFSASILEILLKNRLKRMS